MLEVLLGHMGGPFWARKDAGAWSIPKGELGDGEDPLAGAYGWFWDAESIFGLDWEAMRRFGDREVLDRIIRGEWPARVEHDTRAIHDLVVGRYNPWHAY